MWEKTRSCVKNRSVWEKSCIYCLNWCEKNCFECLNLCENHIVCLNLCERITLCVWTYLPLNSCESHLVFQFCVNLDCFKSCTTWKLTPLANMNNRLHFRNIKTRIWMLLDATAIFYGSMTNFVACTLAALCPRSLRRRCSVPLKKCSPVQ